MPETKLEPCPFCGDDNIKLQLCDAEGNPREQSYLKDPYSGISYGIVHNYTDSEQAESCPIAEQENEQVGCLRYETAQEAIEAWNRRAQNDKAEV